LSESDLLDNNATLGLRRRSAKSLKVSEQNSKMIAFLFALVAAAQAVQVAKRNFDMCTVCTGVVSEVKSMLLAGATVQQASDAMLDTGCLAFNDQQAEVSLSFLSCSHRVISSHCYLGRSQKKKKKKKKKKKNHFFFFCDMAQKREKQEL
jgi:hypothetical protein